MPTPPVAPLISTFCPGEFALAQTLQGGESRPYRARLFKPNINRLNSQAPRERRRTAQESDAAAPKTSSPALNRVTFLPTASTRPAKSLPSRVFFGLRSPEIGRTGRPPHHAPIDQIKGSRANANENLLVLKGPFDVL